MISWHKQAFHDKKKDLLTAEAVSVVCSRAGQLTLVKDTHNGIRPSIFTYKARDYCLNHLNSIKEHDENPTNHELIRD
jgi:hypothetical protein